MEALVNRQSYWIRSGEAELITHAHLPTSVRASAAVLLCGTIGFEAIHAYRGLIRMADELALNDIAAFRFDYSGTCNSSGDANDSKLVAQWQQNIVDQVAELRKNSKIAQISVVGFRLGATLLASVLDRIDVDSVTFWEPVTQGRLFVREIRAAARFSDASSGGTKAVLESGGFVYADEAIEEIKALAFDSSSLPDGMPLLLVSRAPDPKLSADALGLLTEFRTSEYDKMVCEPHYTELPIATIDRITSWHRALCKTIKGRFELPSYRGTVVFSAACGEPEITETPFRNSNGQLFGIVSRPVDYVAGSTPTIVLSNAGSVCNIGPNRVYVQVARALAASGLEVVRFDLRNLGDSVIGDVSNANTPYPDTAGDDVENLLQHCRDSLGSSAFILAGICSGSHTSYHFGLSHTDPDVQEIILINPLTFYWTPGTSLENPLQHRIVGDAKSYARSVRNAKSWRRLLTGEIDYRRLLLFSARIVAKTATNTIRKLSNLWARPSLSRMDKDLLLLEKRGLRVSYVFSDRDPGFWIARIDSPNTFMSQVKSGRSTAVFLNDADHTLSKAKNRHDLIRELRKLVSAP